METDKSITSLARQDSGVKSNQPSEWDPKHNKISIPYLSPRYRRIQQATGLGEIVLQGREYEMNNKYRGRAIIFNHTEFHEQYEKKREGTEKDVERLSKALESKGFKVKVEDDLSKTGISTALNRGKQ